MAKTIHEDFNSANFLPREFWSRSELASLPADSLCIPKHPGPRRRRGNACHHDVRMRVPYSEGC